VNRETRLKAADAGPGKLFAPKRLEAGSKGQPLSQRTPQEIDSCLFKLTPIPLKVFYFTRPFHSELDYEVNHHPAADIQGLGVLIFVPLLEFNQKLRVVGNANGPTVHP
jgi:hypothetical protein